MAAGRLKTMLAALDDLGYRVNYKILRAQYLDVPQKRERLIILQFEKILIARSYFRRSVTTLFRLSRHWRAVPIRRSRISREEAEGHGARS